MRSVVRGGRAGFLGGVLLRGASSIAALIEGQNLGVIVEQCPVESRAPRQLKLAFDAVVTAGQIREKLLNDARVAVSPGIGFGDYGDDHVRFALIENRERTRQAVRGIKEMFRKDGLLAPRSPEKAAA